MNKPGEPEPAKLFLSAIYGEREALSSCLARMEEKFGAMDQATREIPFTISRYYCEEMGERLWRRFFLFHDLVDPGRLVEIKLLTNSLEEETSVDGQRRVNLDPGVMTLDNLALATGKPRPHRLYMGQGIYAELTLVYRNGGFKGLPWSYADYVEPEMISYLTRVRESLKADLREWRAGAKETS